MKNKILVVIDMQNDFIYGALGNDDCRGIVGKVVKRVEEATAEGINVIFTKDTHGCDYLDTREGKNLPIEHCKCGTEGWEIIDELKEVANGETVLQIEKNTFGSVNLGKYIADLESQEVEVELIGVCTDICVIANAIVMQAMNPNIQIAVRQSCCAGSTLENHNIALKAMRGLQIEII
ncbi:cysteine hydrolase [Lachnospiraceae bacterium ZAX-1]